ncbi:hypothetical protein C1646_773423 [Rhizophagus diaphanus]|nr:hypothetical protein C1646_773423 [Rhizophagus diaphanus] [Rhizophagus sp. MUCL 43196]
MKENENQWHLGSKIESRKDANIAVGFGNCSNSEIICKLQASYGELCRVGTMRSITWTNELPREVCHLVLAHLCFTCELGRLFNNQESVPNVKTCCRYVCK